MPWQDSQQIQACLEATFNDILDTRMQAVPIINQALSVEALDFKRLIRDWLGILITPWFMNLLLLPTTESDWVHFPPGDQFEQTFPYGVFTFTVAHEARLGIYAQCSLFSPMFQFQDQSAAQTAAHSALAALLAPEALPPLSRRDILRGRLGKRE